MERIRDNIGSFIMSNKSKQYNNYGCDISYQDTFNKNLKGDANPDDEAPMKTLNGSSPFVQLWWIRHTTETRPEWRDRVFQPQTKL